jgi:hypothetical protein
MNTTTLDIGKSGWKFRVGLADAITSLIVVAGAAYALNRYGASMDVYETWILIGAVPSLIGLVWLWPSLRGLSLGVGAVTLLAIHLYGKNSDAFGADLAAADSVFLLKYFLSSQSAILWMSMPIQ